jgi:hypothetical protein
MKYLKLISISFFTLISITIGYGQPGEKAKNPYAVSTYECAGVYWKTPESGACKIRYREAKSKAWKEGLELVYDSRDGEYRGSIIKLIPNTEYQVELSTKSANTQLTFITRNDVIPIGKTTMLPEGESDKTIVITESGTPDAYHLVTVPPNSRSVLNMKNVFDHGIEIDADYVVVRGIEVRNARVHGIRVRRNRHDIVIEQCYITFWGRIGGPITYGNFEGNMDSGIYAENGTWNLTMQRNLIEDPRGASNDWETGHPAGPQGISIIQSLGGNVIRYNDIVSSEDHGFNDGIGGSANFSDVGNVNRDSDVYGNIIRNVWDNPIEVEGANMNIRVWGNYMDLYYSAVATATTHKGPIYIYRNVFGRSRRGQRNNIGGPMVKTGDRQGFGGGRRLIFHNTALQPNGPNNVIGGDPNCMTRNNIFDVPGSLAPNSEKEPLSDFDYDYYSGNSLGIAKEENRIAFRTSPAGSRLYVSSYKLEFYPRSTIASVTIGKFPFEFGDRTVTITDPVFQIKNPLIDGGVVIPGFNDDYKGAAPDIGAFEVGAPPLEFGRRAYLRYDEGWAPWEKY